MKTVPGVIFDVDGVLVDSYEAHFQSYQKLGDEHQLQMTRADFFHYFGRTTRETIVELWQHRKFSDEQVTALDDRKETLYREILKKDFPEMAGSCELIDRLAAVGFQLAVGSSGPPENVTLVVRQLKREKLFAVQVTGSDVTRGKPDPQVFLIAAKRMGVSPIHCLVIEDASAGIVAARAARMATVGLVSTGHNRDELSAADLSVHSLQELSVNMLQELVEQNAARY